MNLFIPDLTSTCCSMTTEAQLKAFDKKTEKQQKTLYKAQDEFDQAKNQTAYRHAFEWRFMFPKILDEKESTSVLK